MRRFLPTLIFVLLILAALAFTYKDKILPKSEQQTAENAGRSGHRMRRGGRRGRSMRKGNPNRPVPILAEPAKTANVPVYLHGVGTVAGLEVTLAEGEDEPLMVSAGLAVDRFGRLIELPRAACLRLAAEIPLRPNVSEYALEDANRALLELKQGDLRGAKVLRIGQ